MSRLKGAKVIFLIGVANYHEKGINETSKIKPEYIVNVKLNNKKREPLRLRLLEINKILREKLEFNNPSKPYGTQYEEIFLEFKCYKTIDENVGNISLKFSNIYKGVHAIYTFSIDEFIDGNVAVQQKMIMTGITDLIKAIKQKKKGDFDSEKLINDILCIVKWKQNFIVMKIKSVKICVKNLLDDI